MKHPVLTGAAITSALVLAAFFAAPRRAPTAPADQVSASSSASAAPRVHLAWTPGTRYRYDFSLASATSAHAPGLGENGELSSTLALSGALELRALGTSGGRTVLALSVPRVGDHAWKILGGDLLADDTATRAVFEGQEAFVEVAPTGKPERVLFKKAAPEMWKSVTQTLVAAMTVVVPEDATAAWTGTETTPTGIARVAYTSDGLFRLERRRTAYDALYGLIGCDGCVRDVDAHAAIALDPKGHVARIDDTESIVVHAAKAGEAALESTSTFALALVDVGWFEAAAVLTLDPSLESRAAGALRQGEVPERELLAQRVAGLTLEDVEQTLAAYDGKAPPSGFLTRASGLLLQDPALAKKLVPIFTSQKTNDAQRALVMDLLASASTKEAQAAMCDALGADVGRASPAYASLLQRLSFVPSPTPETLSFVDGAYTAGRTREGDARYASAFTAGAMAFAARREGEGARADAMTARLRSDLAVAKSPKETAAMLTALGAAAAPGDGQRILTYATGKDARVRGAAAGALRRFREPEVRRALTDLLRDPAPEVGDAALRSLDAQPVTSEEMSRVASAVTAAATSPTLDGSLVSFLGKHAGAGPMVSTMLEFLLNRATRPEDSARIRFVLDQLHQRQAAL